MIRGVTVRLLQRTQTGVDAFNAPVYSVVPVEISDVLVGQPSSEDVLSSVQLYGKKAVYWLAIPKGDAHDWTDVDVELPAPFIGKYRTFGFPVAGIEENVPLRWNQKVMVERYG